MHETRGQLLPASRLTEQKNCRLGESGGLDELTQHTVPGRAAADQVVAYQRRLDEGVDLVPSLQARDGRSRLLVDRFTAQHVGRAGVEQSPRAAVVECRRVGCHREDAAESLATHLTEKRGLRVGDALEEDESRDLLLEEGERYGADSGSRERGDERSDVRHVGVAQHMVPHDCVDHRVAGCARAAPRRLGGFIAAQLRMDIAAPRWRPGATVFVASDGKSNK